MSKKFKPGLEALGERVVPAAFSFLSPDGTAGSAVFAAPDGYNPGAASQTLGVTDLVVTYGGQEYTAAEALADYEEGRLVSVWGLAEGPGGDIQLLGPEADAGGGPVLVAFDAADTWVTFTLDDDSGTTGAVSYNLPWDLVDPEADEQFVDLADFNLNIAGENFRYGSASYAGIPTARFAYGVFQGLDFSLNTAAVAGFPFSTISVIDLTATATDAITGLLFDAQVVEFGSATLNFDGAANAGVMVWRAEITLTVNENGMVRTVPFLKLFNNNTEDDDIVSQFKATIGAAGFVADVTANGEKLTIGGVKGRVITKVEYKTYTYNAMTMQWVRNRGLNQPARVGQGFDTVVEINQ